MGILENLTKRINIGSLRKDLEALNTLLASKIDNIISILSTKQNNLGFTPENVANKNLAGGYLGLNSNSQFSFSNYLDLELQNKDFLYESFNLRGLSYVTSSSISIYNNFTTVSGFTSGTGTFNIGTAYLNSTSFLSKPMIQIAGSALGIILASYYPVNTSLNAISNNLNNVIMYCQATLSFNTIRPLTEYIFGIGNPSGGGGNLSGNALYLKFDTANNSSKFKFGKVVSNSHQNLTDTNTLPLSTKRIILGILYNKVTDTAYFFANNTLLGSISSVALSDTLIYYPFFGLKSLNSSETTTRQIFMHNLYMSWDYSNVI